MNNGHHSLWRHSVVLMIFLVMMFFSPGTAAAVCDVSPAVLTVAISGDDDGIGGTGVAGEGDGIGGTGILGTITSFGSLCVNGLRVQYDAEVEVSSDDAEASVHSLALGQIVWIHAVRIDDELWAQHIAISSSVVGRITFSDLKGRRLRVSGHDVRVLPGTVLPRGLEGVASLEIGQRVRVSGLMSSGGIVASRIEWASHETPDRFSPVRAARFVAQTPNLGWLSVEGYARQGADGNDFHLSGFEVDLSLLPSSVQRITLNTRVWVSGAHRGGVRLQAERISVRPAAIERPTRPERPDGGDSDQSGDVQSRPKTPALDSRKAPRPVIDRPESVERPQVDRPERPEVIERPPVIERPTVIDRFRAMRP